MHRLTLTMRLVFETPVHTTGSRWTLHVDHPIARAGEVPILPATSLKGALRAAASQVLATWGLPVCRGSVPGALCADPTRLCLVCRVFGHPRRRSPLKFFDAESPRDTRVLVRPGVAISRWRRTSFEQRLFSVEAAEALGSEPWLASAEGAFETADAAREAAALVWLAARARRTLGGRGTRGLGWLASWDVDAWLDGQPLAPQALRATCQEWTHGERDHTLD